MFLVRQSADVSYPVVATESASAIPWCLRRPSQVRYRRGVRVLLTVLAFGKIDDSHASDRTPSQRDLEINYRLVTVLGLDSLIPAVFAESSARDVFRGASVEPGAVAPLGPDYVPVRMTLNQGDGGLRTVWVWRDGVDLIAAIDENGDGQGETSAPDQIDDCYVVDYDANGTVDRVVDWVDVDGDGLADRQILYTLYGPGGNGGAAMTCFVIEQSDSERGFWHLDRWEYRQLQCQWECDFSGDSYFTWGRYEERKGRWISYIENPFSFYDADGDGITEEALQLSGDGSAIPVARWSFDSDGDARPGAEHDYDLSITAVGSARVPASHMDVVELRGGPMLVASPRHARDWMRETKWPRAVLVMDENDRNVDPRDPLARERWEGVIAEAPSGFPSLGGPACGWLNKRYESFRGSPRLLGLYRSRVDGRIHLRGADVGDLLIDRDDDGVADAHLRTEDQDGDGFFDTWSLDIDGDGTFESVVHYPDGEVELIAVDCRSIQAAEQEINRDSGGLAQSERFARDVARWIEAGRFVP
ncbi:MAG: hypothetical protein H6682_00265 [Candidatus Eisenbacteria bacterium]|nr:hypothetical protein [Candidatus Eisenbacteria bacterium]